LKTLVFDLVFTSPVTEVRTKQ